jgi:hypothetical protein
MGETDPRVWLNDYRLACQLGGATTDEITIRNLPLHLADSARTWLEHLPASEIHNWDDLIHTFVGNFQGTYVCPGNSWDLHACTKKSGESLRDFIRCFSKRYTELPVVAHPQTNGQVERANDMILQGLKPRIFDRLNKSGRRWLQELPAVVWSLRTTPSRATRFTPFFLVYGTEAILPTDLEYGSPRVPGYDESANQRAREDSLYQLDEARTVALMHSTRYHQALRRYQARKVRRRDFNEGDLVLRLRQDNRGRHKLSPLWEGPYVVVKVLKPGTYKLANEDGEELTNAWNIQQLRRFYP